RLHTINCSLFHKHPYYDIFSTLSLHDSLAFDPVLSNVKLIAEAWDAGGMYQVGSFPAHHRWAEWNGKYRDTMRSYLKGDAWLANDAMWRIVGSGDRYGGFFSDYKGNYA